MKVTNQLQVLWLVGLLGFTLLMGGCKSKDADTNATTPGRVHVHIQLGKPGSSIEQIKITNSEDDQTMVERETVYRDKHVVREYFAADGKTLVKQYSMFADGHTTDKKFFTQGPAAGSLQESTETYPGGLLTFQHVLYDEDGHLVSFEQYRQDKTLSVTKKTLPDGTLEEKSFHNDGIHLSSVLLTHHDGSKEWWRYRDDGQTLTSYTLFRTDNTDEITTYYQDGKSIFSVILLHGGKKDATYYRQDGTTVWAKMRYDGTTNYNAGPVEILAYKPDGTLDHKQVIQYDDTWYLWPKRLDITSYDGSASTPPARFCQHWRNTNQYYGQETWVLDSVEKYASGGKVEKLYEYAGDGKTLSRVTSYNTDGTKSVRYFRAGNGTLEKEEQYDAAGTVTKTDNIDEKDAVHEQVDDVLIHRPDFDDPSEHNTERS